MKNLFFIFWGIIVYNSQSYSQKITTDLFVNGDSNARTIYRSKANTLTIKGTVADSFLISSYSCKLIRISNDSYVIKLPKNGVEVTFTIMGYLNGQNILLGNYRYALKD